MEMKYHIQRQIQNSNMTSIRGVNVIIHKNMLEMRQKNSTQKLHILIDMQTEIKSTKKTKQQISI